jgi:replicative DNA helicase
VSGDFERIPPGDVAAERVVLGAMMLSRDAIADVVAAGLLPGDYSRPTHQLVHEAILALYDCGDPADLVAVGNLLGKRDELARVGGGAYLHTLAASPPVAVNAGYYARMVADHALLRGVIEAATRAVQLGYEGSGEPAEIAARALEMMEAAATGRGGGGMRPMSALMADVVGALEQEAERGLPTGFADLDHVLTGLAPGQFIITAARPGVGKSVLTTGIAAHCAMDLGLPVLLMSLEMSAEEITQRIISSRGRVPLTSLLQRKVADPDWDRIHRVYGEISGSPLVIDDTPHCTLTGIRARLREMARTAPARLLVVDYLGLLSGPKAANREGEVSALSRGLKLIAREFEIPVLAAAQLNRMPEHRGDKRPVLSDLRDSGAQEQDADVVILLHREDIYDRESPRAGEIDLDVAKNRQGPQTTVTAAFQGHYARCVDMAPRETWSASASLKEAS